MATRYHCDRCDYEVKEQKELQQVKLPLPDNPDNMIIARELCKRCTHELRQWLQPIPRAVKEG